MNKFRLRYICENCLKIGIFHNEQEAFDEGWDYPPRIGSFRVIGPRTCGDCSIDTTLYWAILMGEIKSKDMTSKQKATLARIKDEPEIIFIKD